MTVRAFAPVSLALLAALAAARPAAVPAAEPEPPYARLNAALVANHVLPRYERLAEAQAAPAVDALCGSIAFDRSGAVIAASSPRGDVVALWDAPTGRSLALVAVRDGCGIAPAREPGRFLASSGAGEVFAIDAATGAAAPIGSTFLAGGHWDNHLVPMHG